MKLVYLKEVMTPKLQIFAYIWLCGDLFLWTYEYTNGQTDDLKTQCLPSTNEWRH